MPWAARPLTGGTNVSLALPGDHRKRRALLRLVRQEVTVFYVGLRGDLARSYPERAVVPDAVEFEKYRDELVLFLGPRQYETLNAAAADVARVQEQADRLRAADTGPELIDDFKLSAEDAIAIAEECLKELRRGGRWRHWQRLGLATGLDAMLTQDPDLISREGRR